MTGRGPVHRLVADRRHAAGSAPSYRPAAPDDLAAASRVWSAALSDYIGRLNQPTFDPDLTPVQRLLGHLLATDPGRFWVATRPRPDDRPAPGDVGRDGERIVGFGSAVVRGRTWFLSMLFVDPGEQAAGIGQALLDRVRADVGELALGTATDSAQPISNAMYARLGIVPRLPVVHLAGRVERPGELPALPAGVEAVRFDEQDPARVAAAVDAIDLRLLGYRRPADHAWLTVDGRIGVLFRDERGEPAGYGYTSRIGRIGPVAALRPTDLAAFLAHLAGVVVPAGAQSLWVPGAADTVVEGLLRAGFRLEPFPALLCWTRPIAPFDCYLPISLALI